MAGASRVDTLRLVGAAGTNKVMAGELSRLAQRASLAQRLAQPRKEGLGAVVFPFDPALAALAVRYHRTSSRVLWDLYQTDADRLEPLYAELRGLVELESRPWLSSPVTISVNARGARDFAAGERQVVGTVKNAIVDGASARGLAVAVDPENPQLYLAVRVFEGVVTVSIDLAGRPMNQRGYRVTGGAAPLRENLAAVLVMLARHDARHEVLIDPMAGSGTIAIEAACMADASPVWIPPRKPACASLPPLREHCAEPAEPLFADTRAFVLANELAPGTHAVCKRHVERAGVRDLVDCRQGDFRALTRASIERVCTERGVDPTRGLILCNPPYGERIGNEDLHRLYRDLGRWCKQFPGWRAGFLATNDAFEASIDAHLRVKKPLSNGPLRGYFLLYDL